jgi:hypothetical protein
MRLFCEDNEVLHRNAAKLFGEGAQLFSPGNVPGVLFDVDNILFLEALSYLPQVLGLLLEPSPHEDVRSQLSDDYEELFGQPGSSV